MNTASIEGLIPAPTEALYSLTKHGIVGLTESLRYEYAEKGLHFSVVCPGAITTPIFQKGADGTIRDDLPIPEEAIPADEAAPYILDRVAEHKGIIIVPEEPYTEYWRGYVLGNEEFEGVWLNWAREKRRSYETRGSYE